MWTMLRERLRSWIVFGSLVIFLLMLMIDSFCSFIINIIGCNIRHSTWNMKSLKKLKYSWRSSCLKARAELGVSSTTTNRRNCGEEVTYKQSLQRRIVKMSENINHHFLIIIVVTIVLMMHVIQLDHQHDLWKIICNKKS